MGFCREKLRKHYPYFGMTAGRVKQHFGRVAIAVLMVAHFSPWSGVSLRDAESREIVIKPAPKHKIIDTPLDETACETFSIGESGYSEYCSTLGGFGLVLHHRGARIDLEFVRPGETRGAHVHRLFDYLGDGQQRLALRSTRLLHDSGKPLAQALFFSVEPQPYVEDIPITLIFRLDDKEGDCVIATIGSGNKRSVEDIFATLESQRCRTPFPR